MRKITLLMLLTLLLAGVEALAQGNKRANKLFEEARNHYSSNQYRKGIDICKQVLKIDANYLNAHFLLAEMYKDIDSTRLEIVHLSKAAELSNNSLINFRLGEAFYKLGMYSEALAFYQNYKEEKKIPEKRQFLLACKMASCEFALQSIENPVDFEPNNMGDQINSTNDEYWPTPTLDGKHLVFTRRLKDGKSRSQEDFFMAHLDSMNWEAQPLTGVNTAENEGAQTLSADAKIIFFTACNRNDGMGSCDIYYSRMVNGKWTEPKNAGAPLNSRSWEGQPSLSSDNRWLYFSSNRDGGKGKKDIWRVAFKGFSESGQPRWSNLQNLKDLNTSGNEISPFIHANTHNFYFASDTHVGMGGLDLFSAYIETNGLIRDLKNMGYPINTHKDEMGLTINSIGEVAYFSSARESEKGLDIFSFNLDRGLAPEPVTYIQAKVSNNKTGKPIEAAIELVNLTNSNEEKKLQYADKSGGAMICLPLNRNYAFNVSEEGYMFYSQSMQLADANTLTDPFILDIKLEPIEVGAAMNLYNIYYELDSYEILAQSEPELQKLANFLKKNGKLSVEIQGHTDSTGTKERNLELSEQRAKSVVDYLVKNGIGASRLKFHGYGDTQPVASNDTDEGRKQNRRTTIKIVGK